MIYFVGSLFFLLLILFFVYCYVSELKNRKIINSNFFDKAYLNALEVESKKRKRRQQ